MTYRLTRRGLLAGGALALAALARPRRADSVELGIWGPPAGPSITVVHAIAAGMLSDIAAPATFRIWRSPDEVRAGLASGTMRVAIMPTAAAANLYNRGLGLRLVNVMTDGLLYVISTDKSLRRLVDLRGQKLAVPYRNDTPDIILDRLLAHDGLVAGKDIAVETAGSPIEAMQFLLIGRVDAALLPEPTASATILRAAAAGRTLHRAIDMQEAWRRIGGSAVPQAGLAVTEAFVAQHGALIGALHEALARATAAVNADPAGAARNAAASFAIPPEVIAAAVPHSNLVARRAAASRPALEAMFAEIARRNPALVGGRLPDDAFYL